MRIPSGTTDQVIYFVAVDSTDYATRETGLTSFTVYRDRNGAGAAAMTTPTVTEVDATNMPGVYKLLLDEDMTIGSGNDSEEMVFHITQASMAPVTRTIELYRPKITAGNTLDVTATGAAGIDWGNVENQSTSVDLSATAINLCDTVTTNTDMRGTDSALLASSAPTNFGDLSITASTGRVDVASVAGTAQTAGDLAALVTTVDTVVDGIQTDLSNGTDGLGAIKTAVDAVPDAAAINAEVDTALADIGLDHLISSALPTSWAADVASGSVFDQIADDGTASYDRTTDSLQAIADSGGGGPTAAQIADAVWDEAQADHTSAGTFGEVATEVASILTDTGTTLPATLTTIEGKVDTVDTVVDSILLDTAEIGAAGAGLTAIPWNASWDAEVQSEVNDGLTAFWTSPATLVDLVWDEVITGAQHNVNTSAARYLREAAQGIGTVGTAQSATASTIVIASGGVSNDDILNGEKIQIIEGTGVGQARLITDSVAATDTCTVDRNWVVNPDNTSVYSITGADADIRAIDGDPTAADNLLAMYDGTGYAGGTVKLDVNIASSDDIDLTATQKASVNTEVDNALTVTTYAEPSSVPAATASLEDKIGWLYSLARNKFTQTSTTQTLRNDADSGNIGTSTHSDDGTTYTRGEWS